MGGSGVVGKETSGSFAVALAGKEEERGDGEGGA